MHRDAIETGEKEREILRLKMCRLYKMEAITTISESCLLRKSRQKRRDRRKKKKVSCVLPFLLGAIFSRVFFCC